MVVLVTAKNVEDPDKRDVLLATIPNSHFPNT